MNGPDRYTDKVKYIVSALLPWFAVNARELPWRHTSDPYAVWVSEIMLQQTQVKTVMRYWERWMRKLPDVQSLAKARPERIHKLWEGLGYYTRVRNMRQAARAILEKHGGRFPEDFDEVLALPGVGRYTAGAICSIAFNQPKPVLDGNVIRVLTRLFGIGGDPRDKKVNATLWQLAGGLVEQATDLGMRPNSAGYPTNSTPRAPRSARHAPSCSHLNQSLMELGALVCVSRQPRCELCPVAKYCVAFKQGRVEELPALRRRPAATPRRFFAFVVQKGNDFLIRQRPAGVVNAHLWEFPNVEVGRGDIDLRKATRQALGTLMAGLEQLCVIKHSITRYRITMDVFRVAGGPDASARAGRWHNVREMNRLPFASAHKRILQRLGD